MTIITAAIILILIISSLIYRKIKKTSNKQSVNLDLVLEFDKYIITLQHFLDLAYSTIYQSDIITYVTNKIPIDDNVNKVLCRKYLDILYSLMGENLLKIYFYVFGDESNFINYCLLYFNNELINNDLKYTGERLIEEEE